MIAVTALIFYPQYPLFYPIEGVSNQDLDIIKVIIIWLTLYFTEWLALKNLFLILLFMA